MQTYLDNKKRLFRGAFQSTARGFYSRNTFWCRGELELSQGVTSADFESAGLPFLHSPEVNANCTKIPANVSDIHGIRQRVSFCADTNNCLAAQTWRMFSPLVICRELAFASLGCDGVVLVRRQQVPVPGCRRSGFMHREMCKIAVYASARIGRLQMTLPSLRHTQATVIVIGVPWRVPRSWHH